MYYFVSDVHLGGGDAAEARSSQTRFIEWLDSIAPSAREIYLVGDIFDFWYEYYSVVPKGFVRVLAKFAELTERGVRVVFIAGNHDMWVKDYFAKECGVEMYTTAQVVEIEGKRVHLAHGDNLNIKRSFALRLMNGMFRSPIVRFLFSWLVHPDIAMRFGQWWSSSSRKRHLPNEGEQHKGVDILIDYARSHHAELQCDYYIFGHMHTVANKPIDGGARVMLMNDWSSKPHYIVIDKGGEASIISVEKL